MNYLFIFIIFAIISLIGSSFGSFFRRKRAGMRRTTMFNDNKIDRDYIYRHFIEYAKGFLNEDDKDVPISSFAVRVKINEVPFNSDFTEIGQKYGSEIWENIKNESFKYQELFNEYCGAMIEHVDTDNFNLSAEEVLYMIIEFHKYSYLQYLDIFIGESLPDIIKKQNFNLEKNLTNFNNNLHGVYEKLLLEGIENSQINRNGYSNQYQNGQYFKTNNVDYYAVLGLTKSASNDEIKKRYRELAKKYHPDKNHSNDAKEMMSKINEAYTKIKEERGM